jgi:hypothetical protein
VHDFLSNTRDVVTETLLDSARQMVGDLLHRSLKVLLLYGIATILLGFGLILMLIGGFHALRSIPLPDAAAYAIMGGLALAGGLAAVRKAGSKRDS